MKKLLSFLFCLPALSLSAQTSYPTGAPNCVARYDFSGLSNGSIFVPDVSGNTHNGTLYNVLPTAGWRGIPGTALKFNGQTSWVQVAHTPLLAAQQVTLVGLVRFDGFYNGLCQVNSIVAKGFPHRTSGTYGLYVLDQEYDQDCNTFTPALETTSADLGAVTFTPDSLPAPIQPGKWYFTAVSFNGNRVRIYQELMDSTTGPPTNLKPILDVPANGNAIGNNMLDVVMGRTLHQPYPYWLNGALDEVAIFNRGLSNDEVFSIYQYLWSQTPMRISDVHPSEAPIRARVEHGSLLLESNDGQSIGKVVVYTTAGQQLLAGNFEDGRAMLDISTYPRALFIIKVARNGGFSTLKVNNL